MLPEPSNTYKAYKADTSTFIGWLAETAQKCGYTLPSSSASPATTPTAPAKSTRLKGKARKEAKNNAQGNLQIPSKAAPSKAESVHTVGLRDILPYAHAIADSKAPPIKIPSNIIRAGLRAVSARKRCAAYYKTSADDETARSNLGHSYFISLMEKVLHVLQPCFAVSAVQDAFRTEEKKKSNIFDQLENRFAALDVEEPSEQEDSDTIPDAKAATEPLYELEVSKVKEHLEEEKLFSIFCFYDDLSSLRKFVFGLWVEYKMGDIDLITAATTTNTAFQLAIRNQEDNFRSYPDLKEFKGMRNSLRKFFGDAVADEAIDKPGGLAHWIYCPVYVMLNKLSSVVVPGEIPVVKRGWFGTYEPDDDRTKMSQSEKNMEDIILLIDLWPEFVLLQMFGMRPFARDEFTRGMCEMAETKEIPVWLTFAATCFLDIHHLLRGEINDGMTDLHVMAMETKETFDKHFAFMSDLPAPSTWTKSHEKSFRDLLTEIEDSILTDQLYMFKVAQYDELGRPPPSEDEIFYLFERHPILCGLNAFRLILEAKNIGLTVVNTWGSLTYTAHLYNALQHPQEEYPIPIWPLMDQAISIHTEERIFIGGKPDNITDCFKRACLVLGHSPEQFAHNRRPGQTKIVLSKKGPRGLEDTSALGQIFRRGLAIGESQEVMLHDLELLLNEQAKNADLTANPENKRLRHEWRTSKRLTQMELLQALRDVIPGEMSKLEFPYLTMHEQSIRLLRILVAELDSDLRKYMGLDYLQNESQLPLVGPYIIMTAYQTERTIEHLKLKNPGSMMLQKAGDIMEDFIRESWVPSESCSEDEDCYNILSHSFEVLGCTIERRTEETRSTKLSQRVIPGR